MPLNKPASQVSHVSKMREFYDNLYQSEQIRNPAVLIYDRLRIETIRSIAQNSTGITLIVGVGSHLDSHLITITEKVFVFDLSAVAIRSIYSDNLNAFSADAATIPLPANYFDLIICSEVLEHIPDIRTVISEFARLLKKSGTLIVSSPNWLSWFGLARFLGEKIFNRSFHSSDQPYDDWKTYWKYKKEISPWFKPIRVRGVWYLPPLHYGKRGLPKKWMTFLYFIAQPFEKAFSLIFPYFGHLLVLKCSRIKEPH